MSAAALKNEASVVPSSRARRAAREVLIVDCHDSFVYNLVQLVRECGAVPHLVSCDEVEVESVDHYDRVLLSPGPGLPRESGRLLDVVRRASGRVPVLGVCLGLQAVAEVFGGRLRQLAEVYHGIASPCHIAADDALFSGLENPFVVGRYHSWVVDGNHRAVARRRNHGFASSHVGCARRAVSSREHLDAERSPPLGELVERRRNFSALLRRVSRCAATPAGAPALFIEMPCRSPYYRAADTAFCVEFSRKRVRLAFFSYFRTLISAVFFIASTHHLL